MAISMDKVRAALLEKQAKKNGNGEARTQSTGDNASFPFWNIPDNTQATIRLLRDGDESNDFFWRELTRINLVFPGVVGGEYPTDREVTVKVPCMEMFGQKCPITEDIRPLWKGSEDDKNLARQYYRKKSFLYQGFVVNSPLQEQAPENPIRRFVINQTIHEIIEASLTDSDMIDLPIDEVNGIDFIIKKTKKGQYANYQTSGWARRERSLTEEELTAIETFGLFNLSEFLGRKPDEEELAAIFQMYQDSRNGLPFDADKYGRWFRAYGNRDGGSSERAPVREAAAPRETSAVREEIDSYTRPETDDEPVKAGGTPSVADLLASLRQNK